MFMALLDVIHNLMIREPVNESTPRVANALYKALNQKREDYKGTTNPDVVFFNMLISI